jgi:hypothetical protein
MIGSNVSGTKIRGGQSINQSSRYRWIKNCHKEKEKKEDGYWGGQGRPRVDVEETMKVMEIETKTRPGLLINASHHTRGQRQRPMLGGKSTGAMYEGGQSLLVLRDSDCHEGSAHGGRFLVGK